MSRLRRLVSKLFPSNAVALDGTENLTSVSQKLFYKRRLIERCYAGAYTLNPYILRSIKKLENVVDRHMQKVGAQRIAMPSLAPSELWKNTGRWEEMGSELFKLEDRIERKYCLAPTHEETVCALVANHRVSYKSLPLLLYQITNKFRDEPHPKHALLRGREFLMKDLYTFDEDHDKACETYNRIIESYESLFKELSLNVIKVTAHTGAIGGSMSHEFHLESQIGEDTLKVCERCGSAVNSELITEENADQCQNKSCEGKYITVNGIELAHAFLLGEKYSKPLNVTYKTRNNKPEYAYMGCFGIGITRLLAAAVEVLSTENHLRMPRAIAPYNIVIIPQKAVSFSATSQCHQTLLKADTKLVLWYHSAKGYKHAETLNLAQGLYDMIDDEPELCGEVILDDRIDQSIGFRLREARLLGYPMALCVTKEALPGGIEGQKVELIDLYEDETNVVAIEDLTARLKSDIQAS